MEKPLRVLMINYEYPPLGGGGGVVSRDVAESLVQEGHSVTVLTSLFQDLPAEENVNGVSVQRASVLLRTKQNTASQVSMLSFVPAAILRAQALFRRGQFDVINTHFAIPTGPAGSFVSWRLGVPNVLSIHGGDIFDPSKKLSPHKTPLLWRTVRRMLRSADAVVAQSSDTAGNARTYYGLDSVGLGREALAA